MLAQRVLSAIVLAPLLLLAVAAGDGWFLAAAVAASLLAFRELCLLLRGAGFSPLCPFALVVDVVFLLDAYLPDGQAATHVFGIALALSLVYLLVRRKLEGSLLDWALTWLPAVYAGLFLSYIVALRQLPFGDSWVYLVLGIAWVTDTTAYFVGRAMGRHPFFHRISPRKTMEGAIGGLVGGTLCGVALSLYFGWDLPRMVPFAMVAAIAAELGDLAESLIKRQLGTKDAGRMIPGHGGILDRMDSVVFVGIAAYFWAIWIGGAR